MKILVYGINYYPERIGIGKYSTEMCEWLAKKGHNVKVITAMPYYPNWKIMEGYEKKLWFTEVVNDVTIYRCPLYVPSRVTGLTRIFHEISFALSSLVYWFRFLFTKFDIIISVAPPLLIGIPVLIHKVIHRAISIYHIQDLQLDAAKELGLIKSAFILNLISRLEKFTLNNSDFVSTISEGMSNKLRSKNVPQRKLFILKNWTDTKLIYPDASGESVRELFGIDLSKRIILYSGNIGEKQGLDMIIYVAEYLASHDIVFLVIGDGSYKLKFEQIVKSKALRNIKTFPVQPADLFNKILNLADIHLILQKKAAADLVMPSKFSTILAAGGVAIVTADAKTTLYDIIKANDIAIVIEPENPTLLGETIISALKNDLVNCKRNARLYAIKNLDKEMIMNSFHDFMTSAKTHYD
jgi:colanic acid biosynthesis glycosyl transferase WcaI